MSQVYVLNSASRCESRSQRPHLAAFECHLAAREPGRQDVNPER